MKKILALVIILAVLLLGSYFATGLITERTLKKDVHMVNQSNGLHVEIQQYNRGWFSSTADFKWQMHVPERVVTADDGQSKTVPAQDYTLGMPVKIYHGPIMFADKVRFGLGYADTKLTLPEKYHAQFNQYFTKDSTKPELKMGVLVNYFNKSNFRVNIPAFQLIFKEDNTRFEWQGMVTDVAVSNNPKRVDGGLTIEGINFHTGDFIAALGQVSSDYDMQQSKSGLYTGDAALRVPSLDIKEKNNTIFDLKSLGLETSSDVEDGLFRSDFKASLDKIIAHGKHYGPGRLEMSIKNLDAQVMAKINQQLNQLQEGTDEQQQQALFALLPDVPKLVGKGAEFSISELNFKMPEGELDGNMLITLPKSDNTNPFQLLQKVEGRGTLKIPAKVLRQILVQSTKEQLMHEPELVSQDSASADALDNGADAVDNQADGELPKDKVTLADIEQKAEKQTDKKLENLVQSGVLHQKDDVYIIELKLENAQLLVNGKPFNFDMIKL